MVEEVRAEAVDIILTSVSNGERLVRDGRLRGHRRHPCGARQRHDGHLEAAGQPLLRAVPSRPFRTANLARRPAGVLPRALLGHLQQRPRPRPGDPRAVHGVPGRGARGRDAALPRGVQPQRPRRSRPGGVGPFVNDHIVRLLAGVAQAERPLFLKIAYNGAGGARRARLARPLPRRRRPGRLGRHDTRHPRAARPVRAARRPGRALRTQGAAGRVPARPARLDARRRERAGDTRGRGRGVPRHLAAQGASNPDAAPRRGPADHRTRSSPPAPTADPCAPASCAPAPSSSTWAR